MLTGLKRDDVFRYDTASSTSLRGAARKMLIAGHHGETRMTPNSADEIARRERLKTARHEAGHAVAALHYQCPISHAAIQPEGHNLGATGLAEPELLRDAVVLYCGPLAEKNWEEFRPGNEITVAMVGTDLEGLQRVRQHCGEDLQDCYTEAMLFLGKPAVQQQVDRVASALSQRTRLTACEISEVACFVEPLCSDQWK